MKVMDEEPKESPDEGIQAAEPPDEGDKWWERIGRPQPPEYSAAND